MKPWLRWTLGIGTGLVLVAVALWQNENRRGREMWEETCARLRAAGEPVELADIIPPMIPDEENVAAAPIFAEVFAQGGSARLRKLETAFQKWELRGIDGSTVERPQYSSALTPENRVEVDGWLAYLRAMPSAKVAKGGMPPGDELLLHLQPWQQTFNELSEAVRRPDCRWPLPYELGTQMENTANTQAGASLRPWMVAFVEKGDAERAMRLVLTQL